MKIIFKDCFLVLLHKVYTFTVSRLTFSIWQKRTIEKYIFFYLGYLLKSKFLIRLSLDAKNVETHFIHEKKNYVIVNFFLNDFFSYEKTTNIMSSTTL